jgi:hypothetical protein
MCYSEQARVQRRFPKQDRDRRLSLAAPIGNAKAAIQALASVAGKHVPQAFIRTDRGICELIGARLA